MELITGAEATAALLDELKERLAQYAKSGSPMPLTKPLLVVFNHHLRASVEREFVLEEWPMPNGAKLNLIPKQTDDQAGTDTP